LMFNSIYTLHSDGRETGPRSAPCDPTTVPLSLMSHQSHYIKKIPWNQQTKNVSQTVFNK